MENEKLDFYKALTDIARRFTVVDSEKHPKLMTFNHNHYYVVCNEDMFEEYEDFVAQNAETLKEIFPKQFKCFKLEEMLVAKLILIAMHCKENYVILCGTKFVVIEDKLYAIKMLSCNKPEEGPGFVLMKCDLIEDDRALGSFMFNNQNVNFLLKKLGGIRGNEFDVLKADGRGKAGLIKFSIELFGMVDPIASDAYVKNNPCVSDDNVYVEAGNYKLPNFDTIDSVKMWIGDEKNENNCPFINLTSIVLESNHLKLRKWLSKLCKPHIFLSYAVVKKSNKAVCEF